MLQFEFMLEAVIIARNNYLKQVSIMMTMLCDVCILCVCACVYTCVYICACNVCIIVYKCVYTVCCARVLCMCVVSQCTDVAETAAYYCRMVLCGRPMHNCSSFLVQLS